MHGSLACDRVLRSLDNYRALFAHAGLAWPEVTALARRFERPVGELGGGLLEEIAGIAAGCGRPFADVLALCARSELLPPTYPAPALPSWLAAMREGGAANECTAVALDAGRTLAAQPLLAQNWDWLGSQRRAMVLLRVDTGDNRYMTLTEGGMPAKIGLNMHGLGVCLNILRSPDDGPGSGVPVHVLLRRLLDCADVGAAASVVARVHTSSSSNILCADARGAIASFELSPHGHATVAASDGALCHTNHCIGTPPPADSETTNPSSFARLRRAGTLLAARARHGVADLQALLRDAADAELPICRLPDPAVPAPARVETVASVVMELARGVMHVAPDVPSRCAYVPVPLAAARPG